MHLVRLGLLALTAFATSAFAGSNSALIALPVESAHGSPAVSLVQTADYLCAVVSIRSTVKDSERQMAAVQDALQRLTAAVQRSNAFQLHQGPVRFLGTPGNAHSSFSKSSYGPGSVQTTLRVLFPLSANTDTFDALRQLSTFISKVVVPPEAEVTILSTALAVTAAEQQRERLMQLIREQITATRQQLGANVVTVSGLDSPVLVRQLDQINVELFIDYQLSATLEK